jgi:hypothetical protein
MINGKHYYPLKSTEVNSTNKLQDEERFNRAEKAGLTFGGKTKRQRQTKRLRKTKRKTRLMKKSTKTKRKSINKKKTVNKKKTTKTKRKHFNK